MSGLSGYAQLRRGVYAHLAAITDSEWKVYSALLMRADPRNGTARFVVAELAADIGHSASTVSRCLRALHATRTVTTERGPVQRRYIDYRPAANQYQLSEVRILNFKRSSDPTDTEFAMPPVQEQTGSAVAPVAQQWHSTGIALQQHTASEQGEQAPYSHESHESHERAFVTAYAGYYYPRWEDRARAAFNAEVGKGIDPDLLAYACVHASPITPPQAMHYYIEDGTYKRNLPRPQERRTCWACNDTHMVNGMPCEICTT